MKTEKQIREMRDKLLAVFELQNEIDDPAARTVGTLGIALDWALDDFGSLGGGSSGKVFVAYEAYYNKWIANPPIDCHPPGLSDWMEHNRN